MKHILPISIFVLFFTLSNNLIAQQASSFTGRSEQPDERTAQRPGPADFVPGEILVKFRDDVSIAKGTTLKSSGVGSVDHILKSAGMASLEKLFPSETRLKSAQIVKDPQGRDMKIPSLHNIYKITIANLKSTGYNPADIFKFIDELKTLPEVEYAEPNYIYTIDDMKPVGPVLTAGDIQKMQSENQKEGQEVITPNDPLYSQQWYIPAVKADMVWEQTTGDTSQIIAILDTGVDWLHPDLMNKIWKNQDEIPDNGIDDDGNGLIDDVRGWDYINNDNNPMDDNSHGTHVAGIAAAEANNGIGIAGVNWKAKIMPIKVFQSSGQGDAATIAKGIIYATQKGATVINMSFGSYARSLTMEAALVNSYATTILVASAGNDNLNLNDDMPNFHPTISYPAGLSFVLGIQATQNSINILSSIPFKRGTNLSEFTNYDHNGPIFSKFIELQNYELKAPGENIISTIPNGNYRMYNGTSMSAPIVSGSISLYKALNKTESQEIVWAKFIEASDININIYNAIHSTLNTRLALINSYIVDTLANDDKDGRVDAGETIQLWYKIRNTGAQTDNAFVGVKFGEFEDHSTAQILISQAEIGSISSYASKTNELSPLKIHINSSVVNGRNITLQTYIGYKNSTDTVFQNIQISIENGQQLEGVMDSTLVLTPDKLWFVNGSYRVGANGTLRIKPGTHLIIGNCVTIRGSLIAEGTKDSLILISSATPSTWQTPPVFNFESLNVIFNYVHFYNLNSPLGSIGGNAVSANNCLFDESQFTIGNNINIFTNNLVRNSNLIYFWNFSPSISKSNIFYNNYFGVNYTTGLPQKCIYNTYYKNIKSYYTDLPTALIQAENIDTSLFKNNSFINSIGYCYAIATLGGMERLNLGKQYWGSLIPKTIRKQIFDFYNNSSLPQAIFDQLLISPSDSCHGHVWKVLVNSRDAQDEVVDPVGIGKQRFEVYFNRTMDKSISPQVSFGVRQPYSQQLVNEDGSWSEDGRIYTAYKTVKLTTGDGINTIRVSGAKEANGWNYEIPVEDQRFGFVISAANSASLDFQAAPGLGKVKLEWNNNNLEDGLGYNMYRMEYINDSTLSTPLLINKTLISDTLYTDFSVTPNKKYYYYYKILRTNLAETDSSKVVSAVPFTASKGDANGDLAVNVLDVTSIVSYLLGQNPQPFIFEAADVNNDNVINILDVIGDVNKIIGGGKKSVASSANIPPAYIYLDKNEISFKTQYPVSALQFELEGSGIDKITLSSKQKGFELVYNLKDGKITGILFSFDNKSLPTDLASIIGIQGDCSGLKWGNLLGGDARGNPVKVIPDELHSYSLADCSLSSFPNPFSQSTTINYSLFEAAHVQLEIYDMYGRLVEVLLSADQQKGEYQQIWKGTNSYGSFSSQGFYFCRLAAKSNNGKNISKTIKLIRIGQ